MDLKMNAEEITDQGVSWDCDVQNGLVPIITDDEEDLQCATIAGFLIVGTVPQLPEAGVPWTDFLTGKITFGVLDFYVRESLLNVGKDNFYPEYDIEEDQLTMKVGKLQQEEADVI
ncbi:MAG: hypothetical protein J6W46_01435 [Spirochaetaceae bacterium]|nr:hypothetical protein [Spirochaetaceae bacterium]